MKRIYTIGFTKKTAEEFFSKLKNAGVKRVIDVRLKNESQLAGFSKKEDLRYFLREICDIDYVHLPLLAPTNDILSDYRKKNIDWQEYERQFTQLISARKIEDNINLSLLDKACLLCSEHSPNKCHRRLIAEYLKHTLGDIEISHL